MSLHDYKESRRVDAEGHNFHTLLMAAMRRADTANVAKLSSAYPEVWAELKSRYDAPGGKLPGDGLHACQFGLEESDGLYRCSACGRSVSASFTRHTFPCPGRTGLRPAPPGGTLCATHKEEQSNGKR